MADYEFGARPYLVMATYCVAQYLLAASLLPRPVDQPAERQLEQSA